MKTIGFFGGEGGHLCEKVALENSTSTLFFISHNSDLALAMRKVHNCKNEPQISLPAPQPVFILPTLSISKGNVEKND